MLNRCVDFYHLSRPPWARGLKLELIDDLVDGLCRAPRGRVD